MLHARLPRSSASSGRTALAALVAMVESLPIRLPARAGGEALRADWAPRGYDRTDIEILEWIASHRGGRHGRFFGQ